MSKKTTNITAPKIIIHCRTSLDLISWQIINHSGLCAKFNVLPNFRALISILKDRYLETVRNDYPEYNAYEVETVFRYTGGSNYETCICSVIAVDNNGFQLETLTLNLEHIKLNAFDEAGRWIVLNSESEIETASDLAHV